VYALDEIKFVKKICEDLLNGEIKNHKQIQSLWQNNNPKNKFLQKILDSASEFLVGTDLYPDKRKFENSYEYLCVYVGYQLLDKSLDLDEDYLIYNKILQTNGLTKEKVDKFIAEIK
jgi:hypothetical protein